MKFILTVLILTSQRATWQLHLEHVLLLAPVSKLDTFSVRAPSAVHQRVLLLRTLTRSAVLFQFHVGSRVLVSTDEHYLSNVRHGNGI
jgi:hypothetical protein